MIASINPTILGNITDKMALDTPMNDMDIDMTYDEDEDPEITRLRAQAAEIDAVWYHSVKEKASVTDFSYQAS